MEVVQEPVQENNVIELLFEIWPASIQMLIGTV